MSRFIKLAFFFTLLVSCLISFQPGCTETIYAGESDERDYYTVRDGDTLYSIASLTKTNIKKLVAVNNLKNNIIWPGQVLVIPQQKAEKTSLTREEIKLLARLIHAEARGETIEGKIAVGAVVLNRVKSPYFPNTIEEVVFQKNSNVYQFTPVADGSINLVPDESSIRAAEIAASGEDPTGGALYFYNPRIADDVWIRSLPVIRQIGNHTFAKH